MSVTANPAPATPDPAVRTDVAAPPRLDEPGRRVPAPVASRSWRRFTPLLPAAALILSAAVLWRFNPSQHGFYPRCMLHATTGLDCPGCGILRATHQLLNGHLVNALALNSLYVIALPFGALYVLNALLAALRPAPVLQRDRLAGVQLALGRAGHYLGSLHPFTFIVGTLVGFGIARNLPLARWFGW